MKVFHIDSGKFWRGSQKQIWLLSKEQLKSGINCMVIGRPNSPLLKRCEGSGIPVTGVRVRFEVDPIALADYLRLFVRMRPTVVNIHCSRAHLPAGWAAKLSGVPLVLLWRWLDNPINNLWQRWKYQQGYHAIVTVSRRVAQVLCEGGVPMNRIHVFHVAIDPNEHTLYKPHYARAQIGIPEDGLSVIGTVSFLVPRKRIDTLLEAFHSLCSNFLSRLVIIGDGPERTNLERLAKKLDILQLTKFTGYRMDATALMSAMDIFVLPSIRDAAPVVILEAGLAGLPIVASMAGGIPEYIRDGETGLLFKPSDPKDLSNKLSTLLNDKALAQRLALNHRSFVLCNYTVAHLTRKVESLYRQLLGSNRG